MNRLVLSGPTVSRVCFKAREPTVTMDSTWVSPLVNSPVPWVRGRIPVSQVMGRTWSNARPSERTCCDRIRPRTASRKTALKPSAMAILEYSSFRVSVTRAEISFSPSSISYMPGLPLRRSSQREPTTSLTLAITASAAAESYSKVDLGLPTLPVKSSIMSMVAELAC